MALLGEQYEQTIAEMLQKQSVSIYSQIFVHFLLPVGYQQMFS